ncbi:hypothetical protein RintRC_4428 [Richelia intracellularis]|nr:hypothetical protein RintRC_4428 [Richelia intracellularis]
MPYNCVQQSVIFTTKLDALTLRRLREYVLLIENQATLQERNGALPGKSMILWDIPSQPRAFN